MDPDRPLEDPAPYITSVEKAAADRAALYKTHKARGSLGTYYLLYPDERPRLRPKNHSQESEGRERER